MGLQSLALVVQARSRLDDITEKFTRDIYSTTNQRIQLCIK